MPKISVIIPIYNTAKYLAECLDSLLAQTFTDWEAICVNDGSPDNALEILEKYAARDPRIKIINQENAGCVSAKNNGVALARGEYVFPLDSDDKIAPECLDMLYKIITTTDYSIICPNAFQFGVINGDWDLPEINKKLMYTGRNCIHNSSLYRKADWEKFDGYDEKFHQGLEDYDFWLNFFDAVKKAVRTKERLFYYRIKDISESRNEQVVNGKLRKKLYRLLFKKHPRFYIYKFIRFFYRDVLSEDGVRTIKILKITVYRKRK
jgi:glycosyltransferase involved in cell wall biosynthesis